MDKSIRLLKQESKRIREYADRMRSTGMSGQVVIREETAQEYDDAIRGITTREY